MLPGVVIADARGARPASAARRTPRPASPIPWDEPRVKSPEVIARMRRAGAVAAEILRLAGEMVRPGITTDEIDDYVHQLHIERDAYPSPLNYNGFPKSVCTSANEVICHGIPDSRVLQDGDILNIDVTSYVDGVHGDTNATFFVGDVDPVSRQLVHVTEECMWHGIEAVTPGPADQRHRPGHRGPRQGPPLRRHPGLHRPRHRRAVPRRHPGAALLRLAGVDDHAPGHDVHDRADDQPRHVAAQDVGRRLDRGHRRRQAHRPVRAHDPRHRRRLRRAHRRPRRGVARRARGTADRPLGEAIPASPPRRRSSCCRRRAAAATTPAAPAASTVTDAWARTTPPGVSVGAVYLQRDEQHRRRARSAPSSTRRSPPRSSCTPTTTSGDMTSMQPVAVDAGLAGRGHRARPARQPPHARRPRRPADERASASTSRCTSPPPATSRCRSRSGTTRREAGRRPGAGRRRGRGVRRRRRRRRRRRHACPTSRCRRCTTARRRSTSAPSRGPAVVNLWATWCQPCRKELPAFQEVSAARPDVRFVGVDIAEDAGQGPRLPRRASASRSTSSSTTAAS